jgi:hypothetical protein
MNTGRQVGVGEVASPSKNFQPVGSKGDLILLRVYINKFSCLYGNKTVSVLSILTRSVYGNVGGGQQKNAEKINCITHWRLLRF